MLAYYYAWHLIAYASNIHTTYNWNCKTVYWQLKFHLKSTFAIIILKNHHILIYILEALQMFVNHISNYCFKQYPLNSTETANPNTPNNFIFIVINIQTLANKQSALKVKHTRTHVRIFFFLSVYCKSQSNFSLLIAWNKSWFGY